MKLKNRLLAFVLVICTLITLLPISAITAFATENTEEKEDASVDIKAGLESYIQGSTQSFTDDGYIGIPYEITVYYDTTKGVAVSGYNGTPVILYVINSGAERIGTATDVEIITSMIERGYAVAVLDYKNNAKAVSPALEYSAQKIRGKLKNGDFFTDKTVFPSGTYYENHVVPAGHNVSLSNVFYEIDKHGADGVLEKIVEQWNVDFRGCKRDIIIKWTDDSGNRKTTQEGFDGSDPVWYSDAAGTTVDNENGEYIKIQYTKAMKIADCVKKDGTPIDYNLYMHIIYPDTPDSDVPVMVLSGSSEHLASGMATADRPYLVRYSMTGYAVAAYDFEYIPMARNDHYTVFNGLQSGSVTGRDGTFGLGQYIRSNYQTAAIRYLRHLSLTDHEEFGFDNSRIGLYGNSKGGFQTFLGAAELRDSMTVERLGEGATEQDLISYVDNKVANFFSQNLLTAVDPVTGETLTFDGNSRYQNGKTEDVMSGDTVIVDGGELQPWLTYRGEDGVLREIPSGVQFVYSSCGGTITQNWEGHSPVFTASNYYDMFGSGYSTHNYLENCLRIHDIPSLYFEVPLEHSLVSGLDVNHGVDTYEALFKFTDYYLKDTPTSIVYTDPISGDAGVKTTDGITLRFYGPVSAEEIAKITVKDASGDVATGEWVSGYGKTQWTFNPKALNGGVKYTVTVPSSLKGDNGVEMGNEHSFSFYTEGESVTPFNITEPIKVTSENGTYFAFTVPASLNAPANRLSLRFKVANAAANVAEIYKASSETDTVGELIGTVNLSGAGYYEYDVTDYVMSGNAGETVYFLVKAAKATADTVTYKHDLDSTDGLSVKRVTSSLVTEVAGESVTALKMANTSHARRAVVLENSKIINNGAAVTKADYGRTFTVTIRIYDTVSRFVQLWFNDCTNGNNTTNDFSYSRKITKTEANKWTDVSVTYTVYEMDYGIEEQVKMLSVIASTTGIPEAPYYIDSITVTEHVTDIEITEGYLVSEALGNGDYKAPASEKAFTVNGTEYATLGEAIAAVGTVNNSAFAENPSLATVKLNRDHVLDASDSVADFSAVQNLTLDLNGYLITLDSVSLLSLSSVNADTVNVTVKNGTVIIEGAPLVSYIKATAAGEGKLYNLTFEDIYVTVSDNATVTEVISTSVSPSGANVIQNLSFTDTVFNIDRKALPKTPVKVFPQGTENLETTYTFNGGEIRLSSFVKLTLSDNVFGSIFEENGSGEFTSIVTPESVNVDPEMTVMSSKGYSYFTLSDTADGYKTYEITSAKYSTPYGIIPDDKSPEEYPFAVFSGGELLGVFDSLSNDTGYDYALGKALQEIRGDYDKDVQIVLRRDYDMTDGDTKDVLFHNLGQLGGTLVIDLGEHTLKLKSGLPFMYYVAKYGYDNLINKDHVYDSNFVIKGGTIIAADKPILSYELINVSEANVGKFDKEKHGTIKFEGTAFVSNVAIISTVDRTSTLTPYGSVLDVEFNNCEFDTRGVSSAVTLFGGYDSLSMSDLSVRINGGNITASSLDSVTLSKLDADDSITFGKNSNGDYTTLTTPSSYTIPTFGGVNDEGKCVAFGNGSVSGENTVYTLSESTLITKYGIIPSTYADVNEYPFAVFKDGTCIGAYKVFYSKTDGHAGNVMKLLLSKLRKETTESAQVVLRRDYAMSEATGTNDNTGYVNLSQIGGNITFDFGSYTMTLGSEPLFNMDCKWGWDGTLKTDRIYPSSITVLGGKIIASSAHVINYSSKKTDSTNEGKYQTEKLVDITFNETSFILGTKTFINGSDTANLVHGATMNLTLNGCEIDTTANTASKFIIFDGWDTNSMNRLNVSVNGGGITASDSSKLQLWSIDTSDSVKFGKYNGAYTELTAISGSAPTLAIPTDIGTGYYYKFFSNSSGTVYHLSEKTAYGLIPYDYTPEEYPFAVFMNGTLIGVHKIWCQDNTASALYAARALMVGNAGNGKTVQILMRRDYAMSAADNNYGNLAHFGGTLIIDLGSFTFTSASGKPFLATKAQTVGDSSGTYVCDTTIIVKGGKINTYNQAPIVIQTNVFQNRFENYTRAKIYNITFEGTEFIVPSGGKRIIDVGASNHENGAIFNVTFNNCKFNIETTSNINIFSGSDSDGNARNVLNLTVNGGKITAANMDKVTIANLDANDSFVFGKYNDVYTTLTIKAGSVPSTVYDTAEGEKVIFASTGTVGEYTLTAACTHPDKKDCSTVCDFCGKVFEDAADHTYDTDYPSCDSECNVCGETREVSHGYIYTYTDTEHWAQCECGAIDESTRGAHTKGSKCEMCGRKADGVTSLYGNTLILGSDVRVTFLLDIDTDKAEGATLECGPNFESAKLLSEFTVENGGLVTRDGKTYYKVSYGIAAKELTTVVKARIKLADGSYGTEYSYSAQQYIDTVQESEIAGEITAELKALVNALEVYGKNAAAVLSGGPSAETIENVDFTNVVAAGGIKDETGNIRLVQFSLELKSNIKLRVYFSLSANTNLSDYTVQANGEEATVYEVGNSIYCIEYAIVAANLGKNQTFTVNGNGSSFTLNLSALYYAKTMNEASDELAPVNYKNLMKAIKLYADAAVAYDASKTA